MLVYNGNCVAIYLNNIHISLHGLRVACALYIHYNIIVRSLQSLSLLSWSLCRPEKWSLALSCNRFIVAKPDESILNAYLIDSHFYIPFLSRVYTTIMPPCC